MIATYGNRRQGAIKIPLSPYVLYTHPALPGGTYHDRSPLCHGCPYPRHGMMCWGKNSESCLRTDMQKLEKKWQDERQKRAGTNRVNCQ